MKKVWIIIIIVLSSLISIGGYCIFDSIFPIAEPINYPSEDTIISILLTPNNDNSITIEASSFEDISRNICNAKATRKMSVNDYPTVEVYYTIKVNTSTREYRYYIYTENSQVYIEIPYQGIYTSNQQLLVTVMEYFDA